MRAFAWLAALENKLGRFAATVGCLSFVVGTLVGCWGVWETVRPRKPDVQFVINSESNVVDVRRSVSDLRILFQNVDIQSQSLNLRIIRMTIQNAGDTDVTQGHYDNTLPWGYSVDGGQVIESRIVEASQEYLHDALGEPSLDGNH